MRLNENIKISGNRVTLIPYEIQHVEKYHDWMKSTELQMLTGSEPLSLEDEYNMQKTWRIDENKCTFLILDNETFNRTNDEIESLIGDTNLFLTTADAEDCNTNNQIGEIEIMIAEEMVRGKRLGWESCLLMLKYGVDYLKIYKFIAKIGYLNTKSCEMFKKMQFTECSRSDVFKEITFERSVTNDWIDWLTKSICKFCIENYKNKIKLENY